MKRNGLCRGIMALTLAASSALVAPAALASADKGEGSAIIYEFPCDVVASIAANDNGEFALFGGGQSTSAVMRTGQKVELRLHHGNLARGTRVLYLVNGPHGQTLASLLVFGDGNSRC